MRCGSCHYGRRRAGGNARTTFVLSSLLLLIALCSPAELFHATTPLVTGADDQYVFVTGFDGVLWRIDRASGGNVPIAFEPVPIGELSSDGTTVWLVTQGQIRAVPVNGGASRFVANGTRPRSDGQYVYWIADGRVQRMRIDGGAIEDVAAGSWSDLALTSDAVYLLGNGEVARAAKTGGELTPLLFASPDLRSFVRNADGTIGAVTVRDTGRSTVIELVQFDPLRTTTKTVNRSLRLATAGAIITADQRTFVVVGGQSGAFSVFGELIGEYADGSEWHSETGLVSLIAAGDDGIYVLKRGGDMVIERLCAPAVRRRRF